MREKSIRECSTKVLLFMPATSSQSTDRSKQNRLMSLSNLRKRGWMSPTIVPFSSIIIFPLHQISWIFVINQMPCVSSCWGGRRHTPVVCNESREPHTSHYPSRPVTKKQTNKLHIPATIPVNR